LAQAAAVAAIEDVAHLEAICGRIVASRGRLADGLRGYGFEVLPSAANFVLARHGRKNAADLAANLRDRGVLVRHFRNPPRVAPFLRITVGTDAQCDKLLDVLGDMLGE